jgi:hypothetical protein
VCYCTPDIGFRAIYSHLMHWMFVYYFGSLHFCLIQNLLLWKKSATFTHFLFIHWNCDCIFFHYFACYSFTHHYCNVIFMFYKSYSDSFAVKLIFFENITCEHRLLNIQYLSAAQTMYVWHKTTGQLSVHIRPLCLVCPDVLSMVGETCYRIRGVQWIGYSLHSFPIYLFIIYLYLRCKVCSYTADQIKSYSKKKTTVTSLQNQSNRFAFGDHTVHHVTHTTLLLDFQCQDPNSLPVRL